jgi:putative PIN family toxin of toxin-antitoxin system
MKVILDANIGISYLLAPHEPRTITLVVERCLAEEIELFVPQELIREMTEKVSTSAYLQTHILPEDLDTLKTIWATVVTIPALIESEIPTYGRDPKDDYLVAYGLVHDIDYLVTGDPDLLILEQVSNLRIVKPRTFLELFA